MLLPEFRLLAMIPNFDFGLVILGLAALAFVAGMGGWIVELIRKPSPVSEPAAPPVPDLPRPLAPRSPTTVPLVPPKPIQVPLPAPTPASAASDNQPTLPPLPAPVSAPETAIVEFTAIEETITSDENLQESLEEQVEAEIPAETPEVAEPTVVPPAAAPAEEADFLLCTGQAEWTSPGSGTTQTQLNRAIFRDRFNTLVLCFPPFARHAWPQEIYLYRDTGDTYVGLKNTTNVSVHCSVTLTQGADLRFAGHWQVDRHDNAQFLQFQFTGSLIPASGEGQPSVPPPALAGLPAPVPVQPAVAVKRIIPARTFSLRFWKYRGHSIAEILVNGNSWGESHRGFRQRFSFGKKKARMVVAAGSHIRTFVESRGERPVTPPVLKVESRVGPVRIARQDSFVVSGRRIPRPHLRLYLDTAESFGFGLAKAEALVALLPEIERWAA